MQSPLKSLRTALEFLEREKSVLRVAGEVSPTYEISGIQASLEGSYVFLFENIKGYPGVRDVGALFSRRDRIARLFGAGTFRELTLKFAGGIRKPIPPKLVKEAPCQEVVITENIDLLKLMPVLRHTPRDAGPILAGGNTLLSGPLFKGGTHLSFNRMYVGGKDWTSIALNPASHMEWVALGVYKEKAKVPVTYNIGTPPAVMASSGGGGLTSVVPVGSDEAGMAGGIQGFPVEIVKAKTVDAYAIADAEWVIEGYIDTSQTVWENPEAEKLGDLEAPFFPEYAGYMGRARRVFKFQATAVTHRRDRPIFYSPLAHSREGEQLGTIFREACFYELAERLRPGMVVAVHMPPPFVLQAGVIYQVSKQRRRDEGFQKNILLAALASAPSLRLAIAVDDDIDIYNTDDVLWAMVTRVEPSTGIMTVDTNRSRPEYLRQTPGVPGVSHGVAIDATIPYEARKNFEPGQYPVDRIDLWKWLSDAEISAARAMQSPYDRLYSGRGY